MPTLELIEENSSSCPTTSAGSSSSIGGVPLLLLGAVGVIAVAGVIMYSGGDKPAGNVI